MGVYYTHAESGIFDIYIYISQQVLTTSAYGENCSQHDTDAPKVYIGHVSTAESTTRKALLKNKTSLGG